MKSTIRTGSGAIVITAEAGVVKSNGITLLPHEAMLVAGELERAARKAGEIAMEVKPEQGDAELAGFLAAQIQRSARQADRQAA